MLETRAPLLLVLTLAACSTPTPADSTSACPAPEESCMNSENHAACLEVEATCDGELPFLESCPLQFACSD